MSGGEGVQGGAGSPEVDVTNWIVEFDRWSREWNLKLLVFHHEQLTLLNRRQERTGNPREDWPLDRSLTLLNSTTLLLILAHAEEWITLHWNARFARSDRTHGTVKRAKKLTSREVRGSQEWGTLNAAFEVRHCLLHANGRPDLLEEAQRRRLERQVELRPGELSVERKRIAVSEVFLNAALAAVLLVTDDIAEGHSAPDGRTLEP